MRTSTTAPEDSTGAPSAASASQDEASQGEPGRDSERSAEPNARGGDPLLAAVCHDLRAPLAAVVMGTNFVLQATPEDAGGGRSRRVLEAVLRSCQQMDRTIRDFSDLSQIEAGAVELQLTSYDAAEVLELAGEQARGQADARNVAIDLRRPDAHVVVRGDRDRMLRALAHVVDNAARHAPSGSVVRASVQQDGDLVVFRVSDAGPGLTEEAMVHLFDRAWHARRAGRAVAGCGLAIVRGFVLEHGGRVDVTSEPGTDTTFALVVPKDGPPAPSPSL